MRILNSKAILSALTVLALSATVTSCNILEKDTVEPVAQTDPDGYRTFTIAKNNHYADNRGNEQVNTEKLSFVVLFDSSAVYKTKDPVNQYDINKLYGLSDCNAAHHTNSARMGWTWNHNQLEIHAYGYKNGQRNSEFITAIPIGEPVNMSIEMHDSTYLMRVEDKFAELPRGCTGNGLGYKLFPYFGGDETAPHNVVIKIKELK